MSGDNYGAIYDAIRSRLSNCDVGEAVAGAIRSMSLEHAFSQAVSMALDPLAEAGREMMRPSVLFKPSLKKVNADRWVAEYNPSDSRQHTCIMGVGASPEDAMRDFDKAWKWKAPT